MNPFKKHILNLIRKEIEISEQDIEVPPDPEMGDYAFPTFKFSKKLGKSPADIAKDLSEKIKPDEMVKEVKVHGPYLNFYVDKHKLGEYVLGKINESVSDYGKGEKKEEKVMVEYCQPNTHKAFHIGHVRNLSIGGCLINVLRYSGYPVIAANYNGDIGMHVAKCLWLYLKEYEGKEPKSDKEKFLGGLYRDANKLVSEDEEAKKEVDEINRKLEKGDPELMKLWKETRLWSLDDFDKYYAELGSPFDEFFFESQVQDAGKNLVNGMIEKGIAHESEGAIVIDLEDVGLKTFLLLKSDGTALYSTKDLALAARKFNEFNINKSLYVVGSEQEFYFKQLFATLKKMGFKQADKCFHISYGLVMLEEGKMSSREGNVILYTDLRDQLKDRAVREVATRHPDWNKDKVEMVGSSIAFSAMKFTMLNQDNVRRIVFSPEKALSFEGETGPYLQYTYARINSIFKKDGRKVSHSFDVSEVDFNGLNEDAEYKLVKMLDDFPSVVSKVSESYKTYLIAKYAYDLAQAFNEFYHKCPILQETSEAKHVRLLLAKGVAQVLSISLGLMGIDVIDEM